MELTEFRNSRTTSRLLALVIAVLLMGTDLAFAQPREGRRILPRSQHRISEKQIDKIRQAEDRHIELAVPVTTAFSPPGASHGKTIDTSDVLDRMLRKMSRRDRRAFFGQSTSELTGEELDKILSQAKDIVFHELIVTETDHGMPIIDVDDDGILDAVDAIRYSGSNFHNHRLCGPTIVVRPNQKLIIHLKNMLKSSREPVLDWNPGSEPPVPPDPPAYWMMDAPHNLFTTNIHTHGLHVSPGGGHDNAFIESSPSADDSPHEMYLDYEISPDHVAGTFWYHGHRHGSVAYQLANGMAGALIVLGDPDPNSPDLESLKEIQAANQIKHPTDNTKDSDYGRVFLLQQLVFTKATATDEKGNTRTRWIVDPADLNDRKFAPADKNVGRITEGIPPNKPESAEVLAVNGQNATSIEIQRGQVERWRLIHAGRESALNLAWYNAADFKDPSVVPDVTDAIESYEIATDGIPTGKLTRLINNELFPGYRSDILVRVTNKAVDGEYWLLPSEAKRLTRTHLGPVNSATPAVKLIVRGQLDRPMRLPSASAIARLKRPAPDVTHAAKLDVNFTFADKERFGVANVAHGAGKPYAESGSVESIHIRLNQPQIWNLGVREFLPGVAEAVQHPFHMHVNPFYVPSLGIWKDTIAIDRDDVTQIHFVPTDFSGRSVLHCHILDHEDQGMMKDITIEGTSRSQYPDLYQLERLTERERIEIDELTCEPDKYNVFVFITGMGCPHCVENLVKLWRRSEPLKNLDAMFKCMSASPIESNALASYGLSEKDHFTFHELPDDFNLKRTASGPVLKPTSTTVAHPPELPSTVTHGVLIFDKQQKLRYRYLADRPLSDLDEITYALMELKTRTTRTRSPVQGASQRRSRERQNPGE